MKTSRGIRVTRPTGAKRLKTLGRRRPGGNANGRSEIEGRKAGEGRGLLGFRAPVGFPRSTTSITKTSGSVAIRAIIIKIIARSACDRARGGRRKISCRIRSATAQVCITPRPAEISRAH